MLTIMNDLNCEHSDLLTWLIVMGVAFKPFADKHPSILRFASVPISTGQCLKASVYGTAASMCTLRDQRS